MQLSPDLLQQLTHDRINDRRASAAEHRLLAQDRQPRGRLPIAQRSLKGPLRGPTASTRCG